MTVSKSTHSESLGENIEDAYSNLPERMEDVKELSKEELLAALPVIVGALDRKSKLMATEHPAIKAYYAKVDSAVNDDFGSAMLAVLETTHDMQDLAPYRETYMRALEELSMGSFTLERYMKMLKDIPLLGRLITNERVTKITRNPHVQRVTHQISDQVGNLTNVVVSLGKKGVQKVQEKADKKVQEKADEKGLMPKENSGNTLENPRPKEGIQEESSGLKMQNAQKNALSAFRNLKDVLDANVEIAEESIKVTQEFLNQHRRVVLVNQEASASLSVAIRNSNDEGEKAVLNNFQMGVVEKMRRLALFAYLIDRMSDLELQGLQQAKIDFRQREEEAMSALVLAAKEGSVSSVHATVFESQRLGDDMLTLLTRRATEIAAVGGDLAGRPGADAFQLRDNIKATLGLVDVFLEAKKRRLKQDKDPNAEIDESFKMFKDNQTMIDAMLLPPEKLLDEESKQTELFSQSEEKEEQGNSAEEAAV